MSKAIEIIPGKYKMQSPLYMQKKGSFYVLMNGDEQYKIHKLDNDNLKYFEYDCKVFYIVSYLSHIYIYDGTQDFSLGKCLEEIYEGINIFQIQEFIIQKLGALCENNIILVTPFSEYIKMNTAGIYLNIQESTSSKYIFEYRVVNPSLGNLVQKIIELMNSKEALKYFMASDIILSDERYLKHDDSHSILYKIERVN